MYAEDWKGRFVMKRQTILSAALAASLVLSLSPLPARAQGSAQKITGPEFCSITPGMSYDEVLSIVGDQPDRVSDTSSADTMRMHCTWNNYDYSYAIVYFEDNRVTQIQETSLIRSEKDVTLSAYGQIASGMSYDTVRTIFGGDGALLSWRVNKNGDVIVSYRFEGTGKDDSFCRITFTNGLVSDVMEKGLVD
jgi:hypothetical protein